MVLSDAMLKEIGTLKLVTEGLGDIQIGRVFTDIPRDSSVDVVNQIAGEYQAYGCDGLVALGGGSVRDTAKGVGLMISQDAEDLMGCECIARGAGYFCGDP